MLRLRGLPWDATREDVQRFLSPIAQVDAENIMLVRNLRGDAYAIMHDADAMEKAGTLHRQKVCGFLWRVWLVDRKVVRGNLTFARGLVGPSCAD